MLMLHIKASNALQTLKNRRGAAMIEYGVLVALILAIVIGTVALIGPKVNSAFQSVETQL